LAEDLPTAGHDQHGGWKHEGMSEEGDVPLDMFGDCRDCRDRRGIARRPVQLARRGYSLCGNWGYRTSALGLPLRGRYTRGRRARYNLGLEGDVGYLCHLCSGGGRGRGGRPRCLRLRCGDAGMRRVWIRQL
jgi:hypothetical protein